VGLSTGAIGRAAVPSGASTGKYEAIELRDKTKKRYSGKGVEKAVQNINHQISDALMGMEALDQRFLDKTLIALDPASSAFYKQGKYTFFKSDQSKRNGADMIRFYEDWVRRFPICSIEDGLEENDWRHWQEMTKKLGDRIQIVGDDLFVTNTKRIARGIK